MQFLDKIAVTPLAGVWIEMVNDLGTKAKTARHSPRESVGSLSLQRLEKRIGAGNIKTGRVKIALPPEGRYHVWIDCFIRLFFTGQKRAVSG